MTLTIRQLSLCLLYLPWSCAFAFPRSRQSFVRSHRLLFSPLPPGFDDRTFADEDPPEDGLPWEVASGYFSKFCASEGFESAASSYGEVRPLGLVEYQSIFTLFPALRNASRDLLWPSGRRLSEYEASVLRTLLSEGEAEGPPPSAPSLLSPAGEAQSEEGPVSIARRYMGQLQGAAGDSEGVSSQVEQGGFALAPLIERVDEGEDTSLFVDVEGLVNAAVLFFLCNDTSRLQSEGMEGEEVVRDLLLLLVRLAVQRCLEGRKAQSIRCVYLEVPEVYKDFNLARFAPAPLAIRLLLSALLAEEGDGREWRELEQCSLIEDETDIPFVLFTLNSPQKEGS